MDKMTTLAVVQNVSSTFPIGVYNSPVLFTLKLFKNCIVPMAFLTIIVGNVRSLWSNGWDMRNPDFVTGVKIICLLMMGCLACIPNAAVYIAWNDPQVSDRVMSNLVTGAAISDISNLIPFLVFVFFGFNMKAWLSRTPPVRGLRWAFRKVGLYGLADRLEVKPSDQVLWVPGLGSAMGRGLKDTANFYFRNPSVAVMTLFWCSLFCVSVAVAKIYRIA